MNFSNFGNHAKTLTDDSDVDLFVGMVWDNNNFGTTGIAWVGTVCNSDPFYRTSLNEYFMRDLTTAEVSDLIYFQNLECK